MTDCIHRLDTKAMEAMADLQKDNLQELCSKLADDFDLCPSCAFAAITMALMHGFRPHLDHKETAGIMVHSYNNVFQPEFAIEGLVMVEGEDHVTH